MLRMHTCRLINKMKLMDYTGVIVVSISKLPLWRPIVSVYCGTWANNSIDNTKRCAFCSINHYLNEPKSWCSLSINYYQRPNWFTIFTSSVGFTVEIQLGLIDMHNSCLTTHTILVIIIITFDYLSELINETFYCAETQPGILRYYFLFWLCEKMNKNYNSEHRLDFLFSKNYHFVMK
jgi:hypothetical protein